MTDATPPFRLDDLRPHIYRTRDGRHVVLAGQEPKFVRNLLGALGRMDFAALCERGPGPHQAPLVEFLRTVFAERTMDEWVEWFRGRDAIARLIGAQCPIGPGEGLMIPTAANGQPAFALYSRHEGGDYKPFHLQVLAIEEGRVAHVGAFFGEHLFPLFGLPESVPLDAAAR